MEASSLQVENHTPRALTLRKVHFVLAKDERGMASYQLLGRRVLVLDGIPNESWVILGIHPENRKCLPASITRNFSDVFLVIAFVVVDRRW